MYGEGRIAGGGETARIFRVLANGQPILNELDLMADVEAGNMPSVKVFKDIQPGSDGHLHLQFINILNVPLVNAIEVRPAPKGRMLPVRMVAQHEPVHDSHGQLWEPDHWVTGGVRIQRPRTPKNAAEPRLFEGERFGHFTYRIPVAPGTYQLTLYMTENWFGAEAEGGGGPGSRVFNLFCNHRPLLERFDLLQASGGPLRAVKRVFTGLHPNAQGKIVLHFQPEVNYAMINALEIEDISTP